MSLSRRSLMMGAGVGLGAPGAALAATRPRPAFGAFGLDLDALDPGVSPGDDFFGYGNGGWVRSATIPADLPAWGPGIPKLRLATTERMRRLLEAGGEPAGTPGRKAQDFYAALMDRAAIERLGLRPVKAELEAIAAIGSPAALARALARVSRENASPLLPTSPFPAPATVTVAVDAMQPTRYIATLSQGGLGLPDRDFYVAERFAAQRAAYRTFIGRLMSLAGLADGEARADRAVALEASLAARQRSALDSRQVENLYNPSSPAQLAGLAPGLDWAAFLAEAGVGAETRLNIAQPEAIAGVAALVGSAPLQDWKDYLTARTLRAFAPFGPEAFVDAHFAFDGRALSGVPERAPEWRRAIELVDVWMGQAAGALYLRSAFPAEARARARRMAVEIKAAMGRRIRAAAWMAPATRLRALAKLEAILIEIGGQQPLDGYGGVQIRRDEAFGNMRRAAEGYYSGWLARLPGPVDRALWTMNPQTVNGMTSPVLRKLMFPAAIAQAPIFDPAADDAVNYGALGALIAHELTHQFDDQGSKYDETGALRVWWQEGDLARFRAAAGRLVDQYSAYAPFPDARIDGRLTLSENIGDLGGLNVALDAYHASLGGRRAPVLSGLTGDQRFFLSWAQVWRGVSRETAVRRQLATGPHAPNPWRVATVRNIDAWHAAFNVRVGQALYLPPEARARIW